MCAISFCSSGPETLSNRSVPPSAALPPADVLVLGGGAAGLMAAREAAGRGRRVLVLERQQEPGRKLCISGGGRANFTNRHLAPRHYRCTTPDFCAPVLRAFSPAVMERLVHRWGLPVEERRHGQLFLTVPARNLLHCLWADCRERGVRLVTGCTVQALEALQPGFCVRTDTGTYHARTVILALGSPAWPQIGATGAGFRLAQALGHTLVPPLPALTPLLLPADALPVRQQPHEAQRAFPAAARPAGTRRPARPAPAPSCTQVPAQDDSLAGISLPVRMRLPEAQLAPELARDPLWQDDLLFTHEGISGPATLKASLFWEDGQPLEVDFLPDTAFRSLLDAPTAGKQTPRSLLRRHMPQRLADALLPPALAQRRVAELSRAAREEICTAIHARRLTPSGRAGYKKAEVCRGGIHTGEVDPRTLQSHLVPGLFLAGEVLDVTGLLGGYNLHWAWASGVAAGRNAGA